MQSVTTAGFAFVEFVGTDLEALVCLFEKFGFAVLGQHERTGAVLLRQNEAVFIVNPAPNPFRDVHGVSARAIGIKVDSAANALTRALEGGACAATPAGFGEYVVDSPAIVGIGDSLVHFVDHDFMAAFSAPYRRERSTAVAAAAIEAIDHTSNIVRPESLDRWADFYKDTFSFVQKQYLEVKGKQTGMRARSMVSPCGKVSIPIAASAHDHPGVLNQNDEFIRDYNGEGIQHIALLSSNIEMTIDALEAAGIAFMDAPPTTYYQHLDARVPGHGTKLESMARRGILVDGKGDGRILLQRFTRRQIGPIFFEIIERRGEDGFGEGNFKALFESQEQDQVRRGSLNAS
ncbi:4-hydroxyphenylpyruvate dioxygenase [Paraburkholderia ginsengiterrae]|uniref:4-hydroxyphenylpyruvate dioxygenase n=1 Tax=Paraburkholderia ginsengiterrae TaxID=1462993 RepID=A0A1A9N9F2_9BURK|nr:4-hydroxyphenylpyruvate dioxygenase [Paraburkholderia ginsengiterrae]OAJ55008.1 4-hydroxyphenylpyruvate dioxygenase [Paraburkholderia ginsengiterrae]OAJ61190.1 4-hydroxyphenylpyruvate dioxygenase [Paraburkholderia ginsengiterrae]